MTLSLLQKTDKDVRMNLSLENQICWDLKSPSGSFQKLSLTVGELRRFHAQAYQILGCPGGPDIVDWPSALNFDKTI